MTNYKEIVTKAIIGKAKKTFTNDYTMITDENPDNILGCWVINHKFNGINNNNSVDLNGSFDVNVWYSYDNNTKTQVTNKTFNYNDNIKINYKDDDDSSKEVIVRSLKQPTVKDVKIVDGKVNLNIEKELGVEVIGNTIVKVPIEDLTDDYEDLTNQTNEEDIIDNVVEDYLK